MSHCAGRDVRVQSEERGRRLHLLCRKEVSRAELCRDNTEDLRLTHCPEHLRLRPLGTLTYSLRDSAEVTGFDT